MTIWLHLMIPFSNRWAALHVHFVGPEWSTAAAVVSWGNTSLCKCLSGLRSVPPSLAPWLAETVSGFLIQKHPAWVSAAASFCGGFAMDVLWMIPLLLLMIIPLLMCTSSTFVFYFKKFFYVAWMMVLALIGIPLCILKSGGRDIENMRWVLQKCRSRRRLTASPR